MESKGRWRAECGQPEQPSAKQQHYNHESSQPPQHRLSKLTLSSSLHQLNDAKFLTANNNNYNPNVADQSQTQTNTNALLNNNNLVDIADDDDHANAANSTHSPPATDRDHCHNRRSNSPTTNGAHQHSQQQQLQTQTQTPKQQQPANNVNNTKTAANAKLQREANLDTVHVVVGNEACDLDSAVSCLLMFHIISKMSDEINGKDKTRTLYIPLLNTTRDMLDSKCEVLWFLQKTLNIDKSFLTCKDDIDWVEIKKNGVEVLVTLVDHNYNDEFKDIGRVVEIIDHHQVQNPQWLMENHSSIRLTLDTSVGSCTTLVAERLFYIYAEHHVSDEILLLIYGTVLLDTICLSEKAKRYTRRDVYLLKKLDALLGAKKPVRDELYKQLVEVKNSTRELNFEKLMKRDLKIYKDKHGMRVGIASLFGMAAKEALGLAANIDLDQFFRQNSYEAFIIMGLIADLDQSDSISRDLVLISANSRLFDELCKALELDTSKLDLVRISTDSSPDPEDNIIINSSPNNSKSSSSRNNAKAEPANSAIASTGTVEAGNKSLSQPTPAPETTASNTSLSDQAPPPLYKARIWLQRNVSSSRKVVAPLVLKVLHDGA